VLVPAAAGVLSALGLALGDERRDTVRSLVVPLADAGELPGEGEADVRYMGQSFELTVPLGGDLAETFHRGHEERYGYADRGRALELVALRTAHVSPGPMWLGTQAHTARADMGETATGVVELAGSTAWIPSGWQGEWRDDSLVVTRA
jgi:N-methylhydantoinase A